MWQGVGKRKADKKKNQQWKTWAAYSDDFPGLVGKIWGKDTSKRQELGDICRGPEIRIYFPQSSNVVVVVAVQKHKRKRETFRA